MRYFYKFNCFILVSLALLGLSISSANAEAFEFTATLTSVDTPADSAFSVGDAVSGTYTFTYDGNPDGLYIDAISDASITINSITWVNNGTPGGGNLFIRDNVCCTRDGYQVGKTRASQPRKTSRREVSNRQLK